MQDPELIERVAQTAGLSSAEAERVIDDILAWYREPVEAFVRRRRSYYQVRGVHNPEAFARIADELSDRLVQSPELSERQLRRMIYG